MPGWEWGDIAVQTERAECADMAMWEGRSGILGKVEKWRGRKMEMNPSHKTKELSCAIWLDITAADLKLGMPFLSHSLVYNWI